MIFYLYLCLLICNKIIIIMFEEFKEAKLKGRQRPIDWLFFVGGREYGLAPHTRESQLARVDFSLFMCITQPSWSILVLILSHTKSYSKTKYYIQPIKYFPIYSEIFFSFSFDSGRLWKGTLWGTFDYVSFAVSGQHSIAIAFNPNPNALWTLASM